jgi:hypothetical protein
MSNELSAAGAPQGALQDTSTSAMVFDITMIERMNELAKMMAVSKIAVPQHFRGSVGDCLAVVTQAVQWGMNPFAVAQKTFVINGILGYEAQLVNAVISARAPITNRLEYEWYGPWEKVLGKFAVKKNADGKEYRTPNWTPADEEGCGVRVWSTFRGEREPRVLDLLLTQARTRNSTLWADDPRQQLAYLAVKRWSRLYCPDVILGVYTPDELEERQTVHMGIAEEVPTAPRPAGAAGDQAAPPPPPPPATRADKARSALAARRGNGNSAEPPALPAPALMDVLAQIRTAATLDALQATADLAARLETPVDKQAARNAYAERKAQLQTGTTIDSETGEIDPPAAATSGRPAATDPMAEHAEFLAELEGQGS